MTVRPDCILLVLFALQCVELMLLIAILRDRLASILWLCSEIFKIVSDRPADGARANNRSRVMAFADIDVAVDKSRAPEDGPGGSGGMSPGCLDPKLSSASRG